MLNSAAGHLKRGAPCILYLGTRWVPQPDQCPYAVLDKKPMGLYVLSKLSAF